MKQLVNYITEKLHIGKDTAEDDVWKLMGISQKDFNELFYEAVDTTAEFKQHVLGYEIDEENVKVSDDGIVKVKLYIESSHEYIVDNIPFRIFGNKLQNLLSECSLPYSKKTVTVTRYYENHQNYIIIKFV